MRNFTLVAQNIDVTPLCLLLARQPELWNEHRLRTQFAASPHAQADDIWLMFNGAKEGPSAENAYLNDCDVVPYRGWSALPQARTIIFDLLRRTEGVRLGRTLITRLRPGGIIAAHVDGGAPAEYFHRYQVALKSLPGAQFQIESEVVNFRSGECWLINNRAEHSVRNDSEDDRIVMIVDIRHE